MGLISVNVTGSGIAYVDNPNPVNGDQVTLYANPDTGEQINDIYGFNEYGYPIAFSPTQSQSWIYNSADGNITIYVEFSGGSPPTPPSFPIWLLKKIADNNRRY